MSQANAPATLPKRYEVVADVLRRNIAQKRIPSGTVLLEGPLSDLFRISRAPVQRALQTLEEEGLVHRHEGRGFLAGPPGAGVERRRIDLQSLSLDLPPEADDGFSNRQTWRRIYAAVESDVTRCLVFGRYRIIESELADHFEVSRTIARDVLSRLQERRLVDKNSSSHWICGPITARSIKDQFELRKILEPHGLTSAAPLLGNDRLLAVRDRLMIAPDQDPAGDAAGRVGELSSLFVDEIVLSTPNVSLRDLIRRNLHTVTATQQVLRQLGLPEDTAPIAEQRMIVELLLHGAVEAAATMLSTHLEASKHRVIAQMKIVAVIPQPLSFAAYLRPAEAVAD